MLQKSQLGSGQSTAAFCNYPDGQTECRRCRRAGLAAEHLRWRLHAHACTYARAHAHQERMAQLRQVLDEREKYLLEKVQDVEQEKLSTIERQREQCLTVLEGMRSASRQVIKRKIGQIQKVQRADSSQKFRGQHCAFCLSVV